MVKPCNVVPCNLDYVLGILISLVCEQMPRSLLDHSPSMFYYALVHETSSEGRIPPILCLVVFIPIEVFILRMSTQVLEGNYIKFYSLIKASYPDIKIITNCDASSHELDHPADLYDIHVYASASDMFSRVHQFDRVVRAGPKAFVSEYAVIGRDAGRGSLLAALAESGFLIGLEKNRFNPDAIVFNSWQQYGTPTYWMQHFFRESNGALFHPSILQSSSSPSYLAASATTWHSSEDGNLYLRLKIVNFGNAVVNIKIIVAGLQASINSSGSKKTLLTSQYSMDENSFIEPTKVCYCYVPVLVGCRRAAGEGYKGLNTLGMVPSLLCAYFGGFVGEWRVEVTRD
ncbi:Alpha-L-arabinofuranosidase 1 [Platanthera guangdongensis]|uniref:Alpha-L-arabinofuranosidase 1 n=1 Tax=Platanthera guangdongensis TaxID=2320717 RepID=A0ABR2LVF6_9ASPA